MKRYLFVFLIGLIFSSFASALSEDFEKNYLELVKLDFEIYFFELENFKISEIMQREELIYKFNDLLKEEKNVRKFRYFLIKYCISEELFKEFSDITDNLKAYKIVNYNKKEDLRIFPWADQSVEETIQQAKEDAWEDAMEEARESGAEEGRDEAEEKFQDYYSRGNYYFEIEQIYKETYDNAKEEAENSDEYKTIYEEAYEEAFETTWNYLAEEFGGPVSYDDCRGK